MTGFSPPPAHFRMSRTSSADFFLLHAYGIARDTFPPRVLGGCGQPMGPDGNLSNELRRRDDNLDLPTGGSS
jgi:hypothetical protein